MRRVVLAVAFFLAAAGSAPAGDAERWREFTAARAEYRAALDRVRAGRGEPYALPAVDFYLFGMGGRDKSVYAGGRLVNARTGEVLRAWDVAEELIVPPAYTVALKTNLSWASGHSAGTKAGTLGDRDYPLTWEAEASQAKYAGMARISPEYVKRRLCAPHNWHAAEAFLALREEAE